MSTNRAALHAALSDQWRAAIAEFCEIVGVHPDEWLSVPPLKSVAEALTLYARADELRRTLGYAQERAILEAAAQLQINEDAVRRRVRDWLRAAWQSQPEVFGENLLSRPESRSVSSKR